MRLRTDVFQEQPFQDAYLIPPATAVGSVMAAPILNNSQAPVAALQVSRCRPKADAAAAPFSPEEQELLQAISAVARMVRGAVPAPRRAAPRALRGLSAAAADVSPAASCAAAAAALLPPGHLTRHAAALRSACTP